MFKYPLPIVVDSQDTARAIVVGCGSTDISRMKTDLDIDVVSHVAADEPSRVHSYDESVSIKRLSARKDIKRRLALSQK